LLTGFWTGLARNVATEPEVTERVQEVACPPDQLEVDVVVAFRCRSGKDLDGPAGLLNRRLGYCLKPEETLPVLLARGNGKIAAHWVLFLTPEMGWPITEKALDDLMEGALAACQKAGFERIAIAPPDPDNCRRDDWLKALTKAVASVCVADCLITFDHSYLHDHSGLIF